MCIEPYLNEFSIVWNSSKDSDINHLEHAGVIAAGLVLFQTIVVGSVLVVFYGKSKLSIFFVDLGNTLLCFGNVGHPVGADVKLDGGLKELNALGSVHLFLYVGSLLVEVGCLTALAKPVALHAFKVGSGSVVPAFG
jgi:hypothetical protein